MIRINLFFKLLKVVCFSILILSCSHESDLKSKLKDRDIKMDALFAGKIELNEGTKLLIKNELASKLKKKLRRLKGPNRDDPSATVVFEGLDKVTLRIFLRIGRSMATFMQELKKEDDLMVAYKLLVEHSFWSEKNFYCTLQDWSNGKEYLLDNMDSLIYLAQFEILFEAFVAKYPDGGKTNYKDLFESINNIIESEIKSKN